MLNPKLENRFTNNTMRALHALAEETEKKNIWVGICGKTEEIHGVSMPEFIFFKEFRDDIKRPSEYREELTKELTCDENDRICGMATFYQCRDKSEYDLIDGGLIDLWVK
jgi:hypothetical protein